MNAKTYNLFWKAVLSGKDKNKYLDFNNSTRSTLYEELIQTHYMEALKKMFLRLDSIHDIDWDNWCQKYYEDYKPPTWDVNSLIKNFPKFLAKLAAGKQIPEYLPELAEYELAEFYVSKIQIGNESKFSLWNKYYLNPAFEMLVLQFDISEWIKKIESGDSSIGRPQEKQNILVISRDPNKLECKFTKIDIFSAQIIQHVKENPNTDFNQLRDAMLTLFEGVEWVSEEILKQHLHELRSSSVFL